MKENIEKPKCITFYLILISSNTEEKMLAFQVLGNMDSKKSNTGAVHYLCVSNKKQMLIQRSQHR